MKLKYMSLVLLSLAAFAHSARAEVFATCTSDSGIELTISDADHGFSVEIRKGESSHTLAIQKEPRNPRMMGAPIEFDGEGFELQINTDALASEKGFPSSFSAHAIGASDEAAYCSLQ
jgi:hypothetical protein